MRGGVGVGRGQQARQHVVGQGRLRCRRRRCGSARRRDAISRARPASSVGDGARRDGEDAVGVDGGADVDLDAGPEPVDVGSQQRVGGDAPAPSRPALRARTACPAAQAVRAAPNSRVARSASSTVSAADRSKASAAATWPPRSRPARATSCRASATSGSGPSAAAARCQVARSGSSRADGVRQGPVRLSLLEAGGRLVHRRPDQRVPHRDGVTGDAQQPGPLGVLPRGRVDAQGGGGPSHGADPPGGVGGRDEQQRLHRLAEAAAPVEERALDPRGQGQLLRQRRRPRAAGRG